MYPAGSIVELGSGELALVLEQNAEEKLAPRVVLVADANKRVLSRPKLLDLSALNQFSERRSKVSSVEPGQFRIDPRRYSLKVFGRQIGIGNFSFRL
jgi:hypothetical protein